MGFVNPQLLAGDQRVFVVPETVYATFEEPISDAGRELKVLSCKIENTTERKYRSDNRSTRSFLEQITGKETNTWEIKTYVMGSGSSDVAPDVKTLLTCGVGPQGGGSSDAITYTLSAAQTALPSFSLTQYFGAAEATYGEFMHSLSGCWVNEVTLEASGGEPPTWTFSGGGSAYVMTGRGTLDGTAPASDTVKVASDYYDMFYVGSVVQVGTNKGASLDGFRVSAKSDTARTLTLKDVVDDTAAVLLSAAASDGVVIAPFVPTDTTAGSPIPGTLGSIALTSANSNISAAYGNSGDLPVTAFKMTLNNNIKAWDDLAFTANVGDYVSGFREISGEITFRARRDLLNILGQRKKFYAHDLVITIGDTTGAKIQLELDIEMRFSPLTIPDVGEGPASEVMVTVPWVAIADSAESELVITML